MENTGNTLGNLTNKVCDFVNKNKLMSIVLTILLLYVIMVLSYLLLSKNKSSCEPCAECNTSPDLGGVQESLISSDEQEVDSASDMSGETPTIICYYATWCGHSRMFLPKWDEFEKRAATELPGVKVKKIKCEDSKEKLCTSRGVGGFPTVILYVANKRVNFEQERTADSLINFCKQHVK